MVREKPCCSSMAEKTIKNYLKKLTRMFHQFFLYGVCTVLPCPASEPPKCSQMAPQSCCSALHRVLGQSQGMLRHVVRASGSRRVCRPIRPSGTVAGPMESTRMRATYAELFFKTQRQQREGDWTLNSRVASHFNRI